MTLVSDERTYIPHSEFSPIQVLIKLLRLVFLTAIRLMDDRTSFVQEVSRDHQFLLVTLSICVVENMRGALLAKGPDSSLGEVHTGSCSEPIHMEDEVKDPEDEVEDGRDK